MDNCGSGIPLIMGKEIRMNGQNTESFVQETVDEVTDVILAAVNVTISKKVDSKGGGDVSPELILDSDVNFDIIKINSLNLSTNEALSKLELTLYELGDDGQPVKVNSATNLLAFNTMCANQPDKVTIGMSDIKIRRGQFLVLSFRASSIVDKATVTISASYKRK